MKKIRKILLLICSHILVAGLSIYGAYYVFEEELVNTINQGNNMLNDMALISRYSAYADMQKHNGDLSSYKESLFLFSEALEESKRIQSPMFSENAYQTDKMLIKLALHKLEKNANNTELAESLLHEAVEHCNSTKMKDCSVEKILFISDKMEKNSMFNK